MSSKRIGEANHTGATDRVTPMRILNFFEVTTGDAFDVEPRVAMEYFSAKGLQVTFNYFDMIGDAHDQAFTVAKMMDVDLLGQVRKSLDDALANGTSFAEWKRNLEPQLRKAGWWGKKEVISNGLVSQIQLGSPWRLETIFRTNMQSAYAVGQWQEIIGQADVAPYLMYDAVDDFRTREQHRLWDNIILPVNHPWWQTHFPPNGYNCRCNTIQLDKEEIEALGLSITTTIPSGNYKWTNPKTGQVLTIPKGIDPGFDRNPGASYVAHLNKTLLEKVEALPPDMANKAKAAFASVMDPENAAKLAAEAKEAAKQKAAQDAIEEALSNNTPYLSAAIKQVQKTKAGQNMTPAEVFEAATEKAAKAEQSAALAHYKQAILAGKEPSDKAKAAFKALDEDGQVQISAQIAQQSKVQAAQEAIDEIAKGNAKVTQQKALKQLTDSGELDDLTPIQALAKIDEVANEIQAKASKASVLSGYKKKVLAGKLPTNAQQQMFDSLTDAEKAKVVADIDKKKAEATPQPTPEPEAPEAPAVTSTVTQTGQVDNGLDMANMKQIGGQSGSNPGGLYYDETTGVKYYIKQPQSADNARNEVLAAKLYAKAGVDVPDVEIIEYRGQTYIASRIIDDLESVKGEELGKVAGAKDNFVVDAWLGNWDVVGLSYDNLLVRAGKAYRVDTGGALRYRAQGGQKGEAWGASVDEIDTLRNSAINPQAAKVFGSITERQLLNGARKVLAVSEEDIRSLVRRYGPTEAGAAEDLVQTLLARQADIRKRYPKAATTEAPIKPPKDNNDRITERELKTIKESRLNGYGIATDKDMIEDQEVLLWQERASGGDVIKAALKLRGEGKKKLETLIMKSASDDGKVMVLGDLNQKILQAIKGISANQSGEGLRVVDITRAKEALKAWDETLGRLKEAKAAGLISTTTVTRYKHSYKRWVTALKEVSKMREIGARDYWMLTGEKFDGLDDPNRVTKVTTTGVQFKRKYGQPFNAKTVRRGRAEEASDKIDNAPNFEYYEAELSDGTIVRYITDSDYFALNGRMEIMAKGASTSSAKSVFDALEELGINGSRSSALDNEELYLTQIAYARKTGWAKLQRELEKYSGPENQKVRIETIKAHIEDDLDVDLYSLPGYNPDGVYEAFGHGHRHRYRPDVIGPEWDEFRKNYRLHHEITNGSMADAISNILNSGGKMAPSVDKLRRGIRLGGMSPTADLQSGGASYFFTRIKTVRQAHNRSGIVWKSDLVARLDAISYAGDKYGRVTGDFVLKNRKSGVEEWISAADKGNNETIFKNSLSLFDYMDRIVTRSAAEREAVIKVFRDNGYSVFPDGRPLEEVIQ